MSNEPRIRMNWNFRPNEMATLFGSTDYHIKKYILLHPESIYFLYQEYILLHIESIYFYTQKYILFSVYFTRVGTIMSIRRRYLKPIIFWFQLLMLVVAVFVVKLQAITLLVYRYNSKRRKPFERDLQTTDCSINSVSIAICQVRLRFTFQNYRIDCFIAHKMVRTIQKQTEKF
jgi:hypothetical protein